MPSEIRYTDDGQMEPVLPEGIASALARLRAMTTPYFDSQTADEAEHALRVEIRAVLAAVTPQAPAGEPEVSHG